MGEGGYGSVYKGEFKDGCMIVVKRFRNCMFEGDVDFFNEVEVISKVKYRYLLVFYGCCVVISNNEGY